MVQLFTEGINFDMGRDGVEILTKYFPPTKAAKLRGDITTFVQFDNESIYETWQSYKELIKKVPHHGLPAWLEI